VKEVYLDRDYQRRGATLHDILFAAPPELFRWIRHVCLEYHDGTMTFSHRDLLRFFSGLGFRTRLFPNSVQPQQGFLHAFRAELP
jgi:hypothetical protein